MAAFLTSPGVAQDLFSAVSTSPHSFLQPSSSLYASAVLATKKILDPLASDVSQTQENRKKRKRSEIEEPGANSVLQLREVSTEGFGVGQVWEQAKRVLDAVRNEIERDLLQHGSVTTNGVGKIVDGPEKHEQILEFDEDGFEVGSDEDGLELAEEDLDEFDDDLGGEEEEDELEGPAAGPDDDNIEDLQEAESVSSDGRQTNTFVQDPNNLNDGFFSIDDFNKKSHFLEQQDARGDDDNPSDEDEIDWDADPLATKPSQLGASSHREDEGEENDSEEDGPTFGNADLSAPFSDGEDESDGQESLNEDNDAGQSGLDNTNEIRYADFFEPPPKKPSKTKRMRALPKTQPPPKSSLKSGEDLENDIQRAISDVRRDLLDSEDEASDLDDEESDANPDSGSAAKNTNLSTHEKQRLAIAAEIRRLEAAAVAKRDWTLSGEARAGDRPVNSLIEEDLEFERVGKPVPVITAEVSEEIESLIRRRILAKEFDEIVRRRPDITGSGEARRGLGRVELNDQKPEQGLAAEYEAEHLKATDPGYVDKRSAGLKKQHEEIGGLWKSISMQLDVLSNLHFKPKRPEVEVKVVNDKPTIAMEDARPTAANGEEGSMLAPQEIYKPGEAGGGKPGTSEIVRKSGAAVSREEMTREEKLRRRRREKERGKKAKGNNAAQSLLQQRAQEQQQLKRQDGSKPPKPAKAQEKRDILAELRKGGVKVIGKKGELEDLGGKKKKGIDRGLDAGSGGNSLKL